MPDVSDSPFSALEPGSTASTNAPELTVSELAMQLKRTVEETFDFVRVRGELGRVVLAKSGHLYFDIKDDKATLNTVMWKASAGRLPFKPEEGLEVVAEGRLSTYPGRSNYQMIAERMRPAGLGALMQLLEERKRKLAAEGLFDADRKKPIPFLPAVIGVVTSPTGAVIRDILHRVRERFPVRVIIWPSLVQGEKAAEQVEAGIRGFNSLTPGGSVPRPDVIIVARGGGSIEDLWPFNEERVVRAAAESGIPLISAVGHETDTTLIDHASDRRAPTPTGAAEMAVPVRTELLAAIDSLGARQVRSLSRTLERRRLELRSAAGRLPGLERLLQQPSQRLDSVGQRFAGALERLVSRKRARFTEAGARMRPVALRRELLRKTQDMERTSRRLTPGFRRQLDVLARRLETQGRVLDSLSHEGVLKRGFAIVEAADGRLVRSVAGISPGDTLRLRLSDGAVDAVAAATAAAPAPPVGAALPKSRGRAKAAVQPAAEQPTPKPPARVRKRPAGGDQGDLF
jgi:exodeoxyribonuclease VII large subunit